MPVRISRFSVGDRNEAFGVFRRFSIRCFSLVLSGGDRPLVDGSVAPDIPYRVVSVGSDRDDCACDNGHSGILTLFGEYGEGIIKEFSIG